MTIEHNVSALFQLIYQLRDELEGFLSHADELPPGLSLKGYGVLYELPISQVSAFLFRQAGLWDKLKEAAASSDPQAAVLALAQTAEPKGAFTAENIYPVAIAIDVLLNNLDAIALFSLPMCELLRRSQGGDDNALFQAVLIDPSVLQTQAAADRVSTAVMYDDRSFFDLLAKAITRTKPTRPKPHLDDTRLLMRILDDAGQLEGMTDADLTEWAVNKIGVYPASADPLSAIRDQRRKRDRAKKGPKT